MLLLHIVDILGMVFCGIAQKLFHVLHALFHSSLETVMAIGILTQELLKVVNALFNARRVIRLGARCDRCMQVVHFAERRIQLGAVLVGRIANQTLDVLEACFHCRLVVFVLT